MRADAIPYRWKKLKEHVDLPEGMVMYDLRHYHATVMKACGAPDTYIASDMGHSDIATTHKHYFEALDVKKQEINAAVYDHTDTLLKVISSEMHRNPHQKTPFSLCSARIVKVQVPSTAPNGKSSNSSVSRFFFVLLDFCVSPCWTILQPNGQ
jgi:hypothetical protein